MKAGPSKLVAIQAPSAIVVLMVIGISQRFTVIYGVF